MLKIISCLCGNLLRPHRRAGSMSYTPLHKQQSRERIIRAAAELFANYGYDAVSIDKVMEHAQLTRGAFYAHFSSKQDLYRESILAAREFSVVSQVLKENLDPEQTARRAIESYLSRDHDAPNVFPCPMAFLSTDIANRDEGVREAYTRIFEGLTEIIAGGVQPQSSAQEQNVKEIRQRALAITALVVGGMAVARALTDEAAKEELISACKEIALTLQEDGHGSAETKKVPAPPRF